MQIELNDEELETLNELFNDWGSDCPDADYDKVQALAEKFGFWKPKQPPTEEELKRREEFANSPLGQLTRDIVKRAYETIGKQLLEQKELFDKKDAEIGSTLRIKLPNDYQVKNDNEKA